MSWDHHTSYMEQVEHVVVSKLQTILSLLYQRVLRKDISIDSIFGTQNSLQKFGYVFIFFGVSPSKQFFWWKARFWYIQ